MNRSKLYILLTIACAAGYIWLAVNHHHTVNSGSMPGVCLFKQATGIPCPSCGSTRAVLLLLNGDLKKSLYMNPVGILLGFLLVSIPCWIIYDVARKKASLFSFYQMAELFLKRKPMAIAGILLVVVNWVWNISKGL